jgi:hypothetical protein
VGFPRFGRRASYRKKGKLNLRATLQLFRHLPCSYVGNESFARFYRMVHSFRAVLAACAARADRVSLCLADLHSVPVGRDYVRSGVRASKSDLVLACPHSRRWTQENCGTFAPSPGYLAKGMLIEGRNPGLAGRNPR